MNRTLLRPLLAAAALVIGGCMVAAHPAGPPVMPAGQAASIAAGYARSRGLLVDYTLAARLDRRARWHVELGGAGGRDHALVVVDGYSGAILHARLRGPRGPYGPAPGPPPGPGSTPPAPPSFAPPPDGPPTETPTPPTPPPEGLPPPPPSQPMPAPGAPGPTPAPPPG